tara:strand:+ start:6118 stop:6345 length:228 start_codon:yes stop_codon:yes gene_type:complete
MATEHVKIFSDTSIIVNKLRGLLEQEKIKPLVKDQFESARLGGFGAPLNSVELFVLDTDLEKAVKILEGFKKEIA